MQFTVLFVAIYRHRFATANCKEIHTKEGIKEQQQEED